jgi:hypothetical protein
MSLTALAVVATDLAVKFSVVKVLADHTSGPLMPVTNPEFLLGVAGTVATLMVLAMLAGIVAAALLATRLIQQHKSPDGQRASPLAAPWPTPWTEPFTVPSRTSC